MKKLKVFTKFIVLFGFFFGICTTTAVARGVSDNDEEETEWEVIEVSGERMDDDWDDWEGDWKDWLDWDSEDEEREVRQVEYLGCLADSLAGKTACVADLEDDIAFWSDVCIGTATAAGIIVSVVSSPISGTILAGFGSISCLVAKQTDLALVDSTCDDEIEEEWQECWENS